MAPKWSGTNALARRLKYGVAERRSDRSHRRFSDFIVARIIRQPAEMHADRARRIGHADDGIDVEIPFDDLAILDGETLVEAHVQTEQGAAFEFRPHRILIHDAARVERDVDLQYLELACLAHLDLDHRRDRRSRRWLALHAPIGNRDPAPLTLGQLLSPARLLLHLSEAFYRTDVRPLFIELETVLHRVDACRDRAFIDEGFEEECVGIVTGPAIRTGQNMKRNDLRFHLHVRNYARERRIGQAHRKETGTSGHTPEKGRR